MTVIWKWLRAVALFGFFVLGGNSQLFAEGSWQMGLNEGSTHNQPLQESTELYIDILSASEVINTHICGDSDTDDIRVEIFTETGTTALHTFNAGDSNVNCTDSFDNLLTGGDDFAPAAVGTYRIKLTNLGGSLLNRFDIFVKSDNTVTDIDPRIDQGRLWGYNLKFNAGDYTDERSTSANLYAVVDGGFNGTYYVWELDLDNFAGYVYELAANELGLDSPNANGTIVAGLSAPTLGNSVTPQYKLYFSDPSASYPRPNTLPEISNFRFEDDEGVDSSISPSDTVNVQDTGNFLFTTNLATSGTYAIIIDANPSNPPGGLGDVFLNGSAAPGDNNVSWNGKDNNGNSIPNGSYPAQIVLKTGEFHFTARDVETSGGVGSVFKGLTINAVLDNGTVDTANKVFWDDKTILNMSHTPDDTYNVDGSLKYHNWGGGSSRASNEGNEVYIDTYAIGYAAVPVFTSLAIEPDDTPQTKMIGNVFDDANGNGVRDSGEAGFSNIAVTITEPISGYTFNVSTDSNGSYVAYTYEPSIIIDVNESMLPTGYIQTAGTDPETVDVSVGGTINIGADGYYQAQADLLTTKTVDNATPNVGDTVTYTLTVRNNGAAEATNVSLTDQLPAGITYDSDTPSQGTYNSGTGLWTIGTLVNGASVNLTLSGTVDSGTSGSTIINMTTAAIGDQVDPTTVNDDLNESITVLNNGPVAVDDNYTVSEDGSVNLLPLTDDSDPDGDLVALVSINGTVLTPGIAQTISVTNGTVTISTLGVITFVPNLNYNGPVSFPYVITDGKGATATANENITVTAGNDAPVVDTAITDQNNLDADTPSVDVSGNFSDLDGDTLTYTATGLPTGLTISSAGVISGTIDKAASQGGTNGVYSVTVTAKDPSNATVDAIFTWTVTNPAPTATDNTKSTNEDTAVSGNVINNDDGNGVDSDPDGDTLSVTQFEVGGTTYTVGQTAQLTEGNLTIAGSGAYTFTPAANSTDAMPQVTYTLSDGEGGTDTATLDITINAGNDVPVANPDTGTTQEDTPLVVAAASGVLGNDTDPDGDTLSVTGYNVGGNSATVGSPLVLTEGNLTIAADGSYTFDPAPDFNGPVPAVTYDIEDINGETASSTLTLTVEVVNDVPVAEDDSQSTPANTAVSVPVLNNDHDIENDSFIIVYVNTTDTHGTVDWDANGTVIFTPETDFIGTTTFTYTVEDSNGGTDTATVTITITDPTDPASNAVTAVADSASTEVNTDVDIPVLINDYDPENDDFNLTNIVTAAVNGTASINDNGTPDDASDDYITYEPNTDFIGNDTFEYEIRDENGNTDIAIVTITVVDPAADPVPNAVADAATTDIDEPVTLDVLDNDAHPTDDLNVTAVTQPANGTVIINPDGTITYTPNPGFDGHDTFMYTITDSTGDRASAAVTITLKRLSLTLNAFCQNDVAYISYDIQLQGVDPSGQTATLTWTGADGETEIEPDLPLNNTHHLWAGAEVDGSGNGTVWPGWNELSDGSWEIIYSDWRRWNPDQSDATVTVTLSVNLEQSVTVQYPSATAVCSPNPVPVDSVFPPGSVDGTGLPQATDNLNVPITSYNPTVINVLANGDSFGVNGPGTVEIKFTQPVHGSVALDDGGTPNDPTDDVLIYTPRVDINNVVDRFTYMITDAAGNTSTATVTLDVNCASSQTSDSGDALGTLSIMMMMFLSLMTGLYFVRKEKERGNL